MKIDPRWFVVVAVAAIVGTWAGAAGGADDPTTAQPVVLDTYSFWRMHHTLEAPVIEDGGKATPITYGFAWMDMATAGPPAGWTAAGFDDSTWLRGPARMSARTPYLSRLCMRGYFTVTDPAQVKNLSLTLLYQGGAVVYLNGKELARGHLAAGQTMAERYPADAFVDAKGELFKGWDRAETELDADSKRRLGLRVRSLSNVRVPAERLRKGVNVLAIEIVRTSYPAAVDTGAQRRGHATIKSERATCLLEFNTCQLVGVQLQAATGSGLQSAAVRAPGLHVWNSDVPAGDFDMDFGGQAGEPLRPVRIVAARNGAFNGKFVVGASEPLRGLKVTVGDLAASGGRSIPASAVQVRYAQPWGLEAGAYGDY
jgi:hypothetical protein